jgi:ATP-binding cassette, subfamily B, multidrug efflux pump
VRSLIYLLPYFKPYKRIIFWGILSVLGSNISANTIPVLLMEAVNVLTGDAHGRPLWHYSVMILIAAGFSAICRYYIRQTLIVMSRLIEYDLRQKLWDHVQNLPMREFQQASTGDLMARLTNDVNAVRSVLGPVVMYGIDNLSNLIFMLAIMFWLNPVLTGWSLLPLPLLSLAVYGIGRGIHVRFTAIQECFSKLTARAQQNAAGVRVLRAYGREEHEVAAFGALSLEYQQRQLALTRMQALFRPLLGLLYGCSLLVTLWVGGRMIIEDKLAMGVLVAFMVYLEMLIWPMISIGWITNIAQQGAASMKRLQALLSKPREERLAPAGSPPLAPVRGDLRFEGVTVRHTPDGPEVLREVTLDIPAGTTCAIVGRTGAGKSTLLGLVPGFLRPTQGKITLDGRDLREWPLAQLRGALAMAPQTAFLFSDTLADNLAFGRDNATPANILEAAERAQLTQDLAQLPDGLDTLVGERGITLSGGQKQRACLARALLAEAPILILDDCFSALDTQTEERIREGLKARRGQSSTLIVSHRLSSVQHADQIVVLEGGRIVERGTHAQLAAGTGWYADTWRKQQLETELDTLS